MQRSFAGLDQLGAQRAVGFGVTSDTRCKLAQPFGLGINVRRATHRLLLRCRARRLRAGDRRSLLAWPQEDDGLDQSGHGEEEDE